MRPARPYVSHNPESHAHVISRFPARACTQTIVSSRKNAALFIKIKSANFSRFTIIRKERGENTGRTAELSGRISALFVRMHNCIDQKTTAGGSLVFASPKCYASPERKLPVRLPKNALRELYSILFRPDARIATRGPGTGGGFRNPGSRIAARLGNFPLQYGARICGFQRYAVSYLE